LTGELKETENALDETRNGIYSAMNDSVAEKAKIANLQSRILQIDEQDARGRKECGDLSDTLRELTALLAQKERERGEIAGRRSAAQEQHAVVSSRLAQAVEKKKSRSGPRRRAEQACRPGLAPPLPARA
jgi:chromosome segregation ATPase